MVLIASTEQGSIEPLVPVIFLANFKVFIHKAQGKSAGNSHCKEPRQNCFEFLNLEAYVEIHAMSDVL